MSSDLPKRRSKPAFNVGKLFDIPTGKMLNEGLTQGGLTTFVTLPRRDGSTMMAIHRLMTMVKMYAPNTRERWACAVSALRSLGYRVEWEDETQCPKVYWVNTEGNADDEAKFINDILNKDYMMSTPDPDTVAMARDVISAFKLAQGKDEIILIDSISNP